MKLTVVMPVYNERETVKEIVERVLKVPEVYELVVVDDCSTDGTYEVLKRIPGIKLVRHERNMGKGAAIRTGIRYATGDYMVVQDADLEYNPEEYGKLLSPILRGEAVVVYGSRFLGGGEFLRASYIANKILTFVTNLLFNGKLTDMETCYKCLPVSLLKKLRLKANRFEFEPEVTAKLLRLGYKIKEVPISYKGRSVAKGKKIRWKDGVIALWTLFKIWIWR